MENASKALLIAGAILLCILIIAIGMFIYNSASTTITESMTSLSTQEIDAFNNQFTTYQGAQSGSNIKSLMGRLIANADTYKAESTKLPRVYVSKGGTIKSALDTSNVNTSNLRGSYIDVLTKIRNAVDQKHEYWVDFSYQANGIIDYITISYSGKPDSTAAARHRK